MQNSSRVQQRWRDALTRAGNWVDARLAPFLAPHFPERYCRRYLATLGQASQSLPRLERLCPTSMERGLVSPVIMPVGGTTELNSAWQMVARSPRSLVLGCVGSGKSTLLRSLAWRVSSQAAPTDIQLVTLRHFGEAIPELLPILVDLAQPGVVADGFFQAMVDSLSAHGFPQAQEFLLEKLESGECLLLLDALDHIQDGKTMRDLNELIDAYPRNIWVATARPTDPPISLPGFSTYSLQGIASSDIAKFVDQCEADGRGGSHAPMSGLLAACERSEGCSSLATLPLLLATMCQTTLEKGLRSPRLPVLCEACVQMLLGKWRGEDALDAPLQRELGETAQHLAYDLQQRGSTYVTPPEMLATLELLTKNRSERQAAQPDHLLDLMIDQSGLLFRKEWQGDTGGLEFARPTLQSYLSARWIVTHDQAQVLRLRLADPLWRDTIILVCSLLPDPQELLQTIASHADESPEKWLLLAQCIAESAADDTPAVAALGDQTRDQLYALVERDGPAALGTFPPQRKAAQAVAGMDRALVSDFYRSQILDPLDAERRRRAALAMGWLGEEWAVPSLGKALGDESEAVAREAAVALGRISGRQAVLVLPRALHSPRTCVRATAAQSLAAQGRREAMRRIVLPILIDALDTRRGLPEDVPALAEKALSEIGPAAIEALRATLNDQRASSGLTMAQRGHMARVLVTAGDTSVLPILIETLKSGQIEQPRALIESVQVVGEPAVRPLMAALVGADSTQSARIVSALAAVGLPAVVPLIEGFASNYPEVRNAALRALESIGVPARDALIKALLHNDEYEIRRRALAVLRQISARTPSLSGDMVMALINALDDSDPGVRANAVRYLGEIRDPVGLAPLLAMAGTLDPIAPSLRRAAIQSLGAIGSASPKAAEASIPLLIEILPDPQVGEAAALALRSFGELAVPPLVRVLHTRGAADNHSQRERCSAAWSVLEHIGGSARPTDESLLGLAAAYARLHDPSLSPDQVLNLTKALSWWRHGEELHRSLASAQSLANVSDMSGIVASANQVDWADGIDEWLRPHIQRVMRDLRNVIDTARLFHSLSGHQVGLAQDSQRDALLKARDALLSTLSGLEATRELAVEATLPFERLFYEPLLSRWHSIIHGTARQLRGRASLEIDLLTPELPIHNGTVATRAVFRVFNRGDSPARNLSVTVSSRDVQVVGSGVRTLEPLGIGEMRTVEVEVAPRGATNAAMDLVARYDDEERQLMTQTSSSHVRFVDAPSVYAPIGRSPYVVGMPIKTSEMFYGRSDIFDWVRENISSQHQEQPLLLYGERRMGKTSVLYQLLRQPPTPQHIPLLFDLQLYGYVASAEELLYELATAVTARLEREGISVPAPAWADYATSAYRAFRHFCDRLDQHLGDRRIIIMMDEFGVLITKVRDHLFDANLFDFLRGIIQRSNRFSFLFTGAYEVRRMQQDFDSILFNMPKVRRISYLSPDVARNLIEQPVQGLLDYHPLVIEKILAITACHPYFVQYICHELLQLARRERRNYVELSDLDIVTQSTVQDATGNIEHGIYVHLSASEKRVIAAAANITDDVRVYVPVEDIIERLTQSRLGMPRETIIEALRALCERDLVTEMRMGQQLRYAFRMGLFRMWLTQNEMLLRLAQQEGTT